MFALLNNTEFKHMLYLFTRPAQSNESFHTQSYIHSCIYSSNLGRVANELCQRCNLYLWATDRSFELLENTVGIF